MDVCWRSSERYRWATREEVEVEEVEAREEGTTEVIVPRMEGGDTVAREGVAEEFAVVLHKVEEEGIGETVQYILNGNVCMAKLKIVGGYVGSRMAKHRVLIGQFLIRFKKERARVVVGENRSGDSRRIWYCWCMSARSNKTLSDLLVSCRISHAIFLSSSDS
mmetsp:Transcript_22215/g.53826  ORF Transcript_22215/g.53826 Transcript_22215/m.53826 type:complete len:163 (+) Transcript_22215:1762-2250(+)